MRMRRFLIGLWPVPAVLEERHRLSQAAIRFHMKRCRASARIIRAKDRSPRLSTATWHVPVPFAVRASIAVNFPAFASTMKLLTPPPSPRESCRPRSPHTETGIRRQRQKRRVLRLRRQPDQRNLALRRIPPIGVNSFARFLRLCADKQRVPAAPSFAASAHQTPRRQWRNRQSLKNLPPIHLRSHRTIIYHTYGTPLPL